MATRSTRPPRSGRKRRRRNKRRVAYDPKVAFARNKATVEKLRRRYRELRRAYPHVKAISETQYIAENLTPTLGRNPRGGKLDRCLREVSGVRNPYAVCKAALRRRSRNPLPARSVRGFTLVARRGGSGRALIFTGRKFAGSGRPVIFANSLSAITTGKLLRLQFPALRGYRLTAHRA